MGLFDPDKQKYITRGIDAYVPIEVQIQIFESIERWRQQGVELDYLQVSNVGWKLMLKGMHHKSFYIAKKYLI